MCPVPRDYRNHPNPRLFSYEILADLIDKGITEFTSTEISKMFQLKIAEACTRINVLKRYKLIKMLEPKSYPAVYEITKWGRKYIERKLKK